MLTLLRALPLKLRDQRVGARPVAEAGRRVQMPDRPQIDDAAAPVGGERLDASG